MALLRAKSPPRQGVILLIVVILLTLFLVVGLSFVLYAESEASSSRIYRESQTVIDDKADEDTTRLLNWALGQLIYDVRDDGEDLYSALRGHSLARLTYGWNYANIVPPPPATALSYDPNVYNAPNGTLNQVAFNGIGALRVNSFLGQSGPAMLRPYFAPYKEDQLVNYTSYGQLDGVIRDPERIGFRPYSPSIYQTAMAQQFAGGANVPYTFPDRNNMFLAAVRANGTTSPAVLMPSFFRPFQLGSGGPQIDDFDTSTNPKLRFWLESPNAPGSSPYRNPAAVAYKYLTMRPRPADMYFNYSDPTDPHNFPLPKDRGGDVQNLAGAQAFKSSAGGSSDSFWMDLNYPVLTARNGKQYKPLFAFLVTDLDGKVNINVHGNLRGKDENNPPQATHASNQGAGKHEVNLAKVLNADPNEWKNVFGASARSRYGADGVPGGAADTYPDMPLDAIRSMIASLDTDGVDETRPAPNDSKITRKFTFPLPQNRMFPDYTQSGNNGGYDELRGNSRLRHPLLYNALSPRSTDTPFAMGSNLHYLHGFANGTNHLRSELASLLPLNLSAGNSWRRFLLTTHSYDLDVPGMSPCVDNNPYTRPNGQPYPKAQQPQTFNTSLTSITNPSTVSDARWQFGAGGTNPPAPTPDGRVPLLSRIDLNRHLTSYYTAPLHNFDSTRVVEARKDRQWFATDIFHRLVQATGANLQAPPTTDPNNPIPEYEALRWLAQLAVNIVDYIDEDDVATAFDWVAAKNLTRPDGSLGNPYSSDPKAYVYGTESPNVLLNEVYAEMRNKLGDDDPVQGAQQDFDVNFFIELYNPRSVTGDTTKGFSNGQDRHAAMLRTPAGNNVYQVYVYDQTPQFITDLRKDVSGTPNSGTYTPKCALTNFQGTIGPGIDTTDYVKPNTGSAPAGTVTNQGFYVVSADADVASGEPLTPTLKVQGNELRYTIPKQVNPAAPAEPVVVLLRRLANPHLPPQPAANQVEYNPYITVDVQTDVRVRDSVKVGASQLPLPPNPGGFNNNKASQGRVHPFAGLRFADQTGGGGSRPSNSFFNNNSNSNNGTYDWVQHLNRPLVNALELLQVSGYHPHELTLAYTDAAGTQKNLHRAPWKDSDARIYRVFEFLTTGERNVVGSSSSVLPANASISLGGRKAGMININSVWDKAVFDALCDAQQNSNNFTQADVDTLWAALQSRRSANLGGTGTVDKPFVGLAGPPAQQGDPQFDPASGNAGSASSYATGGSLERAGQQHPYLTDEVLAKIGAHLTTRSNLFEVYVTVGFFEVIDPTSRPVKLGAEIRARDGSFIRHKFFAVVDRTNIGMDEPTGAVPDANLFKQSNGQTTKPVFLTSLGAIPRLSSQVTLTAAPERYDPSYDSTTLDATYWSGLAGKYIYLDTGIRRERIRVQAVTVAGSPPQVTFQFTAPTQYDHPAGTTVTTFRPGNPGPQGDNFKVSDGRYKYVVPYTKIVE